MDNQIRCPNCGVLQGNVPYCENCGASFTGFSPKNKTKDSGQFVKFLKTLMNKIIFMAILAVILYVIFTSPEWIPNLLDHIFDYLFEMFGVEL